MYNYGGNMSVINNMLKPESKLKKTCDAISYHVTCKSVVMRESLTRHIRPEGNPADF